MERTPLKLAVLAGVLALAVAPAPTSLASGGRQRCTKASTAVRANRSARAAARTSVLCLMNAERQKRGLRPLTVNPRLQAAATGQAHWMVHHRFFSHYRPGGADLVRRLRVAHYSLHGTWFVGENIGCGRRRRSAPAKQVRAWMASYGHRANILNPRFRAVGLGVWSGTPLWSREYGTTFVVDFGSKR